MAESLWEFWLHTITKHFLKTSDLNGPLDIDERIKQNYSKLYDAFETFYVLEHPKHCSIKGESNANDND